MSTESQPTECIEIRPQPKQARFLSSPADLTFFGGGAFGGKTYAGLLDLCRWIHLPRYRGVLFRRTRPQITEQGGVWDESQTLYRALGGAPNHTKLDWRFPSGAVVGMRGCDLDKDVFKFKSMQADVIGFEQLEEFSAKQFWYLLSRNRGSSGVRSYSWGNYNPQPGWLAELLQWWWDPVTGYAIESRAGVLRWMCRLNDQIYWADSRDELQACFPGQADFHPKTVTFIPSRAEDNKIGLAGNPGYIATLRAGRHVDMERLLKGNHKIRDDEGCEWPASYFDEIWATDWPDRFELSVVAVDPSKGRSEDSDYSAIVFLGFARGKLWVDANLARRPVPDIIRDAFTMAHDYRAEDTTFEADGFQELLAPEFERYCNDGYRPSMSVSTTHTGGVNKKVRIRRLGGYLKAGRLKVRRTPGGELLVQQLQGFPLDAHDDGPDALEMGLRKLNKLAAAYMGGSDETQLVPV